MTDQPPEADSAAAEAGPLTIIVGCPARGRHWILPTWDQHVRAAVAEVPGLALVGYQFVVGDDDSPTLDLLDTWDTGRGLVEVRTVDEPRRLDTRDWTTDRLAHMVVLRNLLLGDVRRRDPDLFLSLDADMLLAPGALQQMVDTYQRFQPGGCWAVGGKAYMLGGGQDRSHPSFGVLAATRSRASYTRGDTDYVIDADLLMGIKLMDRRAYGTDYRYDRRGEDVGWSVAVRAAGGRLLWDGRTASKHVTEFPWLYKIDPRVGF